MRTVSLRALGCAALLVLGACAPTARPMSAVAPPHVFGAVARGRGPLGPVRVAEIAREVAELRRLAFVRDVPVSFVDDRTFEARAASSMADTQSDGLLEALTHDEPEESYRRRARYLLAIYSPRAAAVFVRRQLPAGWSAHDLEVLLAHELVHALQFQHFDPERILAESRRRHDIDGASALHAFLEGEAEVIAAGFSARRRGAPPRRAMVEAGRERSLDPRALLAVGQVNQALSSASASQQAATLFPYQFGPYFASALVHTNKITLLNTT